MPNLWTLVCQFQRSNQPPAYTDNASVKEEPKEESGQSYKAVHAKRGRRREARAKTEQTR